MLLSCTATAKLYALFSTYACMYMHTALGIISPYKAQIKELRKALDTTLPRAMSQQIEVNTVDGFQGREKDVILFSCVRTNGIGFLKDERRLNVAITRARYACVLIGNAVCLRKNNTWSALIQHLNSNGVLYEEAQGDLRARHENDAARLEC